MLFRSAVIPVGAPFPHIAAHVIKAQFVGFFATYRPGFTATVSIIPDHLTNSIAPGIFILGAERSRSTPRRILPLLLRRQSESFAGFWFIMQMNSFVVRAYTYENKFVLYLTPLIIERTKE